MWQGAPVFTKPGIYDGDDVIYFIYKHEYDDEDALCWYLSAFPIGAQPGDGAQYVFYYNVGNDDPERIPPATNWKKDRGYGISKNPPPFIVPVKEVLQIQC